MMSRRIDKNGSQKNSQKDIRDWGSLELNNFVSQNKLCFLQILGISMWLLKVDSSSSNFWDNYSAGPRTVK